MFESRAWIISEAFQVPSLSFHVAPLFFRRKNSWCGGKQTDTAPRQAPPTNTKVSLGYPRAHQTALLLPLDQFTVFSTHSPPKDSTSQKPRLLPPPGECQMPLGAAIDIVSSHFFCIIGFVVAEGLLNPLCPPSFPPRFLPCRPVCKTHTAFTGPYLQASFSKAASLRRSPQCNVKFSSYYTPLRSRGTSNRSLSRLGSDDGQPSENHTILPVPFSRRSGRAMVLPFRLGKECRTGAGTKNCPHYDQLKNLARVFPPQTPYYG